MKQRVTVRAGILVAAASLLAAACSGGGGGSSSPGVTASPIEEGVIDVTGHDPDAWLKLMGANAPQQLDPLREVSPCSTAMLGLVYDRLIRMEPDGTLSPGIAESWSAPDPTTFELLLRPDVSFQDGTALDAEAVVAHLERARDSADSVVRGDLAAVSSIEATDDRTVVITLSEERAGVLPTLLTGPLGMVPSPAALAAAAGSYGSAGAVGAGPYQHVANTPNDHMRVEAWDGYWEPERQLLAGVENFGFNPQFTVDRIRSGELNYVTVFDNQFPQVEAAAADGSVEYKVTPATQFGELFINFGKAPFDDIRVRQAIQHAVDRAAMAEVVTGGAGVPAWGPLDPGSWAHSPEVDDLYPYDPDQARQLLADAGHPDGLTIRAAFVGNPYYQTSAEALQSLLADAGITLELSSVTPAEINNAIYVRQDFDAAVTAYSGSPDPGLLLEAKYGANGNSNPSKVATPGLDELLAEGAAATDPEDRADAYQAAEQLVMEQALAIPLYHNAGVSVYDPSVGNIVKGYTTCSLGDFITPPTFVAND